MVGTLTALCSLGWEWCRVTFANARYVMLIFFFSEISDGGKDGGDEAGGGGRGER